MDPRELARTRKQLGVTREDLAKLSGVSSSQIASIEGGKVDPPYSKMKALTDAFMRLQKARVKKVSGVMSKNLLSVQSAASVKDAIALMRKHAISQLPVFEGERLVGSISEKVLVEWMSEKEGPEKIIRRSVKEVMGDPFPTVSENTPVDMLYSMLAFYQAILVTRREKVVGLVTKADLLNL